MVSAAGVQRWGQEAGWNRLESAVAGRPVRGPSTVCGPSPLWSPPALSVGAGPIAGPRHPIPSPRAATWTPSPSPSGQPTSPQNVTTGGSSGDNRDSVSRVRAWEELWSVWSPVPPFPLEGPFLLSFPNVSVP